jgi:hypothetical protein
MAEKRKFAALAELHRSQAEAPERTSAPAPDQGAVAPDVAGKGRGRPAIGKRSNPEYKLYAHYLKKRTHRQVAAKLASLHAEDEKQPDLSDLVQELLEDWLLRQSA